jgi:translation initiation factor IF-3
VFEKLKNEEILKAEFRNLTVIDEDGNKVGVVKPNDAIKLAYDKNLDLVMVGDINAENPVCKIMDYSKYIYDMKKKNKNKNNNNHNIIKELCFRPNTFINDLQRLVKQAQGFIDDNMSVRFTVQFKGREVSFAHKALESFNYIEKELKLPKGYTIKRQDVVNNNKMTLLISK